MQERPTVRVVLLDPEGRVALMRASLPGVAGEEGCWFTVGGGVEPGESLMEAARREVREETGLEPDELGPVVWLREGVLDLPAYGPRLFKESYVVARCGGGAMDRSGWQEDEKAYADDLRWWSREELLASPEVIYPPGFAVLLEDILAERYPAPPRTIAW